MDGSGPRAARAPQCIRKRQRIGGGERAAPGVADHDRAPDAKLLEGARDQLRLPRRRSAIVALRTRAPAVAGAVYQNDTMRGSKLFAERQPHVLKIAAGAVDQNDRRLGAGSIGGQAKHRHVQAYALHLNELAGRRMRGFKPGDTKGRGRCKQCENQNECDEIKHDNNERHRGPIIVRRRCRPHRSD